MQWSEKTAKIKLSKQKGVIEMKKNSDLKLRIIVFTGLFAALVCVLTMLHIPVGNGYIHVGDSLIYLSSMLLPFPCGLIAGGIGGGLSDLFSGYPVYFLPTLIIKSINSLIVYIVAKRDGKIINVRSVLAVILSGAVTVLGYYLVAVILYGGFGSQLATIPGNIIQAVGSALIFIILGLAFDTAKLKEKIKF